MDSQKICYRKFRSGRINAVAKPFLAGPGDFTVNVIIMDENYFNQKISIAIL